MVYKWKFQPRGNVSAQMAGECIEGIAKRNKGAITAKKVLAEARPKRSPLHPLFEWDDTVAAERYRETQAQTILVQLVVIHKGAKSEEPLRVRAFVSVEEKESIHYTPFERAMSRPQLRQQLILQALSEIKVWREKYKELEELSAIFEAIGSTAKVHSRKKTKRRKAG